MSLNGLKVTELRDGIKVYNLTAGKSLPKFLTDRQKRRLNKTDDFRGRVELIQDFEFPTAASTVAMSGYENEGQGQFVVCGGVYPPMLKIFDLENLSLKCERFVDAEIIRVCVLENSFRKIALLRQDRTIELHAAYGKHHTVRIPKFGRDMIYQKNSCDLVVSASASEVYRLNLEQGRFLAPYVSGSPSVNRVAQSPFGCLLGFAGEDGALEMWDTRTKACSARLEIGTNGTELTALEFSPNGLEVLTGTSKGTCYLHDIRMVKPLIVREHPYDLPIHSVLFHSGSGNLLSADPKMVKIWDRRTGDVLANIETSNDCETTDMCLSSDKCGLLFLTGEQSKMISYYIPRLGPAPKWCSFLDNLTEELEEQQSQRTTWDDYKFVTKEELESLNLSHLIGTPLLRGYMHGFFMDARLYVRVKAVAAPEKYDEWRKQQIKKKIEAKQSQRINIRSSLPSVNKELALKHLSNDKEADGGDDRFKDMFSNPDFQIDEESEEFKLAFPSGITTKEKELRKKVGLGKAGSAPAYDSDSNHSDGDGHDPFGMSKDDDEEIFSNARFKKMVQHHQEENGKEAESTKVVAETKKQTKKLTFNHVHNAELVPGSEKTIKRKRELEKKRLTTSFTNRLDEEKLMLQKMKEKRENNKKDGGIYSITYKAGSERADQRDRKKGGSSRGHNTFSAGKSGGGKKRRKKKGDW